MIFGGIKWHKENERKFIPKQYLLNFLFVKLFKETFEFLSRWQSKVIVPALSLLGIIPHLCRVVNPLCVAVAAGPYVHAHHVFSACTEKDNNGFFFLNEF